MRKGRGRAETGGFIQGYKGHKQDGGLFGFEGLIERLGQHSYCMSNDA